MNKNRLKEFLEEILPEELPDLSDPKVIRAVRRKLNEELKPRIKEIDNLRRYAIAHAHEKVVGLAV